MLLSHCQVFELCTYGTYRFIWNLNNGRDLTYFTYRKHIPSQRWRKGLAVWKINHWINWDSNPGPPAWIWDSFTTTPTDQLIFSPHSYLLFYYLLLRSCLLSYVLPFLCSSLLFHTLLFPCPEYLIPLRSQLYRWWRSPNWVFWDEGDVVRNDFLGH